MSFWLVPMMLIFQSTLPARGATHRAADRCCHRYFNPRSPHGERLVAEILCVRAQAISIHAPRTGSDKPPAGRTSRRRTEISIHAPRTGSDVRCFAFRGVLSISIHAPRTGSDLTYQPETRWQIDFNPRSPHGERRIKTPIPSVTGGFQSTLPARGATIAVVLIAFLPQPFQSTLPARGATSFQLLLP